jgi:fatty aldehyde-generating acyl-ACP reductase
MTWPEAGEGAACVVLVSSAARGTIALDAVSADTLVIDAGHPRNGSDHPRATRGGRVCYAVTPEPEVAMLLECPEESHACLAEACILAFENRAEDYSLGRGHITLERMQEMLAMANAHGVLPAKLHPCPVPPLGFLLEPAV